MMEKIMLFQRGSGSQRRTLSLCTRRWHSTSISTTTALQSAPLPVLGEATTLNDRSTTETSSGEVGDVTSGRGKLLNSTRWRNADAALTWLEGLFQLYMPEYEYEGLPRFMPGTLLLRRRGLNEVRSGNEENRETAFSAAVTGAAETDERKWYALHVKSLAASRGKANPYYTFSGARFSDYVGLIAICPTEKKLEALHKDDIKLMCASDKQARDGAKQKNAATLMKHFRLHSLSPVGPGFSNQIKNLLQRLPQKTRSAWYSELGAAPRHRKHEHALSTFLELHICGAGLPYSLKKSAHGCALIIARRRCIFKVAQMDVQKGKAQVCFARRSLLERSVSPRDGIDVFLLAVHDCGQLIGVFVFSRDWMRKWGKLLDGTRGEQAKRGSTGMTLYIPGWSTRGSTKSSKDDHFEEFRMAQAEAYVPLEPAHNDSKEGRRCAGPGDTVLERPCEKFRRLLLAATPSEPVSEVHDTEVNDTHNMLCETVENSALFTSSPIV
ncbi:unnamed protein product [Amoebophrya sp. A25]|nr:unnamed protein product [Amoebophrya sp. A25]|eukprot:GSA25T00009161001.1